MPLFSQLEEMQWKQLQHDEAYHKEIWLLTVQQRITHMTLHMSKYSSKLTIAAFERDSETLKKTAIDALIIAFSCANIFSKLLSKFALPESFSSQESIDSAAEKIFHSYDFYSSDPDTKITLEILGCTGRMCKLVESLDHLETLEYREGILDNIASIFKALLALCYSSDMRDIPEKIANRLYEVESKNYFFNKLGNYKKGY
ncbi:hypothetical protein [Pseudomonas caspiana]|uniref:hypothetical protein n=1 Tax=Pseudomonas caspiana TaxID=1451454 RepID=UPI0032EB2060